MKGGRWFWWVDAGSHPFFFLMEDGGQGYCEFDMFSFLLLLLIVIVLYNIIVLSNFGMQGGSKKKADRNTRACELGQREWVTYAGELNLLPPPHFLVMIASMQFHWKKHYAIMTGFFSAMFFLPFNQMVVFFNIFSFHPFTFGEMMIQFDVCAYFSFMGLAGWLVGWLKPPTKKPQFQSFHIPPDP